MVNKLKVKLSAIKDGQDQHVKRKLVILNVIMERAKMEYVIAKTHLKELIVISKLALMIVTSTGSALMVHVVVNMDSME